MLFRSEVLRESFIERVLGYARVQSALSGRWTVGQLVAFHSREKCSLLAHNRQLHGELGRLVASPKEHTRSELAARYTSLFMKALSYKATTRKHVDVLTHICGHFKKLLAPAVKQSLRDAIEDYRQGRVSLVSVVSQLADYAESCDVAYIRSQSYLQLQAGGLVLTNHA